METKSPKLSSILVAAAFALAAVCVAIFLWSSFGGSLPLGAEGYRFDVSFPQAANLYPNSSARIAGVPVGKVVSTSPAGQRTEAVIEIDDQYAPLPDDVRAILRNKTVLGETYVELTPGSPDAPKLADGGHLPTSQVASTQRLDQVLSTFDAPTRKALRQLVTELAGALHRRGPDLNADIGQAPGAAEGLGTVMRILDRQRASVHQLVGSSARVLEGLGARRAELQTLVTAGDQLLATTAARNRDLTATVNALPPFLSDVRRALVAYRGTATRLAPALRRLRTLAPGLRSSLVATARLTPQLAGLFRQLPSVMRAAAKGLPASTRVLRAARPLVDVLYPAGRNIEPFFDLANTYRHDIGAAVAKGAASAEASTAAPGGGRLHYLRVLMPIVNEGSFGFGERAPTNRHNPYPQPGSLSEIAKGGLRSWDCDNLDNPQIFPPVGPGAGPPPCRVQKPWRFAGHTRSFPHLVRARR
jgi:phospholipid/cholesterol/gamma-HCH transport system substrate-binding protein